MEYENQIELPEDDQSQNCDFSHGSIQHQTMEQMTEILDLATEDGDTSMQNALQREWPSDDDVPNTPTPCQWNEFRASEREKSAQEGHMDPAENPQIQFLFPDGSWKDGHVNMRERSTDIDYSHV